MSWTSWSQSITKIAREAQRGIDKVLDISDETIPDEYPPDRNRFIKSIPKFFRP